MENQIKEDESIDIIKEIRNAVQGSYTKNLKDAIILLKEPGYIKKTKLEEIREYKLDQFAFGGKYFYKEDDVKRFITLYEEAIKELQDKLNDK